jgi:hydroxymethylbilane synthase
VRNSLIVGSRGSKLALIQTGTVISKIKALNPGLEVTLKRIATSGDKDRHTSLENIGINVFVKEIEDALLNRRIDLAVHSLKDVPTDIPAGLKLIAVLEREDPRDVLVARAPFNQLPAGSKIGTGSLRRSIQLHRYRPDIQAVAIRGNVDTRMRKVISGELDGVIIAAAGLSRLGCLDRITEYLPPKHFLPSVGQGTLALEARQADADIAGLAVFLNHLPTWQCVTAERAFLLTVGGGCRAPIAALGTVNQDILNLQGMIASIDGEKVLYDMVEGNAGSSEGLGLLLAQRMLQAGADELINEVKGR